ARIGRRVDAGIRSLSEPGHQQCALALCAVLPGLQGPREQAGGAGRPAGGGSDGGGVLLRPPDVWNDDYAADEADRLGALVEGQQIGRASCRERAEGDGGEGAVVGEGTRG